MAGLGPGIGIAASGGGDSTALLHLAAGSGATGLRVATVDHGLRPAAAEEARAVAAAAAALGLPHETLRPAAPLRPVQADLRAARRSLLLDWAARRGLRHVLTGHTLDDQAETVLMRLARGGGAEGLSGIPAAPDGPFRRPLLGIARADLRDWLRARGVDWIEDPSNEDAAFERARIRRALAALGPDAPPAAMLARTARRMGEAAEALDWAAGRLLAEVATASPAGDLALERGAILAAPPEIARRALRLALGRVRGRRVHPAEAALDRALGAAPGQGGAGLVVAGCRLRLTSRRLRVFRDPAQAAEDAAPLPAGSPRDWDGRWRVFSAAGGRVMSARAAGLPRPEGARAARIADLAWQGVPALVGDGPARALFGTGREDEGARLLPPH